MKFDNQIISKADMRRAEPIVEINKNLPKDMKLILSETSKKSKKGKSIEYSVYLPHKIDGIIIEINEDGSVDDVTIIDGHKWIFKADESKIFDRYIAKKIAKQLVRNAKAREVEDDVSIKFSQSKINKLYKEIQDEENEDFSKELAHLQALKEDLEKGSGKFIVVNSKRLFYGDKGYSKRKIFIKIFNSFDEAEQVKKSSDKVVKI